MSALRVLNKTFIHPSIYRSLIGSQVIMARPFSSDPKNGPFNFINNQRVNPIDSAGTFDNLEPRSGKLLAPIPISGAKEIDRAVNAASSAFKIWSQVIY